MIIESIQLDQIKVDPNQPRKTFNREKLEELRDSLTAVGLIQPIIVRPTNNDGYMLVVGERRYKAAKMAEFEKMECVVFDIDDRRASEIQLSEGHTLEPYDIIERGNAWHEHREKYDVSRRELSKKTGVSEQTILRYEGLQKLNNVLVTDLREGKLTITQSEEIARIKDKESQKNIADEVRIRGITDRETLSKIVSRSKDGGDARSIVNKVLYGESTIPIEVSEEEIITPMGKTYKVQNLARKLYDNLEHFDPDKVPKMAVILLQPVFSGLAGRLKEILRRWEEWQQLT